MTMLLKVREIFDLSKNTNSSKFTKSFINQHQGEIPVYGASMDPDKVSYGYVEDNLDEVKYFNDCLTWNIDGSMCVVHKRKGKFSLSEKVIPLIMLEKWKKILSEDYLKIEIESRAKDFGFGYGHKAGKSKLGEIELQIPTLRDGAIDLKAQLKYVNRFNEVSNIKYKLEQYLKVLTESIIQVEDNCPKKALSLEDDKLFNLQIGRRVLKKELIKKGIPLFSANVFLPFGYVGNSILNDFSKPSIIWGIDGNFDWNYIESNYIFSITDHCGRLVINNSNINPKYVWYQLNVSKSQYGFNRVFRASLENIIENITIEIPINENGKFDLPLQNRIVEKYDVIAKIKKQIEQSIINCISPTIGEV